MNDNHTSPSGLRDQEKANPFDNPPPRDVSTAAGQADLESRFSPHDHHTHHTQLQHHQPPKRPSPTRFSTPHLRPLLLRTAIFLLPSPLHPRLRPHPTPPDPTPTAPTERPSTSYLDGVRGLAALVVFLCHLLYTAFSIAPGYGANHAHHHLPLLPFIRLLFSGPPMVCVFFVVSGYALSLTPLRLARDKNWARFARTLSSLTLRRAVRLFAPTAASTAGVVAAVRLGWYERARGFAADARYMPNVAETHWARMNSTGEQVAAWAGGMVRFVHAWDWEAFGGLTEVDVHLWTIPVEFRCSMMVFLTLVGTARLRRGWRGAVVGALVMYAFVSQRWEMVLFYAGMVLAEVDVARGAHGGEGGGGAAAALPAPGLMSGETSRAGLSSPSSPGRRRRRRSRRAIWNAISVVGLYFMSQPDEKGAETPGWVFLTSLIPEWWNDEHRFWQSIGAVLFVWAVGRSPGWQRFFNLGVVQYFGKISYALYLMHGPIMHTVGYVIEQWAWGITGIEGRAFVGGFALATVFVVPIVIWVSDVFWRAVDAPVVKFARWFEASCSIPE